MWIDNDLRDVEDSQRYVDVEKESPKHSSCLTSHCNCFSGFDSFYQNPTSILAAC